MSENVATESAAVCYDKKLLNYFKLAAKIHRNPVATKRDGRQSIIEERERIQERNTRIQERKEDNV